MTQVSTAGIYTISDVFTYNCNNNNTSYQNGGSINGYNGFIDTGAQQYGFNDNSSGNNNDVSQQLAKIKELLHYYCKLHVGSSYTLASAYNDRYVHIITNRGQHYEKSVKDIPVEEGYGGILLTSSVTMWNFSSKI